MPVGPRNFYALLQRNETVLLFPGGVREANHGRGEAYALFWPEKADFVRMAARFNAVIVPFGAVGAADSLDMVADAKELARVPGLGPRLAASAQAVPAARAWQGGTEDFSFPLAVPSLSKGPARFYFCFGQPYDTRGLDPADPAASAHAYAEVKQRVAGAIDYLLVQREKDPFRALAPRLLFESLNKGRPAPAFPVV